MLFEIWISDPTQGKYRVWIRNLYPPCSFQFNHQSEFVHDVRRHDGAIPFFYSIKQNFLAIHLYSSYHMIELRKSKKSCINITVV